MPALTFFIGKGGVGKTTLSAAYAVRKAWSGAISEKSGPAGAAKVRRTGNVLVLSTDPAHSLADIFQVKLGDTPQRIPLLGEGARGRGAAWSRSAAGKLYAWQINAEKEFHDFLRPFRDQVLDLIESGTIFSQKEIEPLLNTTLPGMAEVAALLAIHKLLHPAGAGGSKRRGAKSEIVFDHIVVDTAPIGHTLRLFELPEHFSRFLDFLDLAGSRDRWLAQRFGGNGGISSAFLEHWKEIVAQIKDGLSAEQSQLCMVTSAEEFSLNEALRSTEQLKVSAPRLRIDSIVLNRVVLGRPADGGKRRGKAGCARCVARAKKTKLAQTFLKLNFPRVPILVGEDPGFPVVGVDALAEFGAQVFRAESRATRAMSNTGKKTRSVARNAELKAVKAAEPKLKRASWPEVATPLTFTVGKGGVGKTTVSAALGFHQRAVDRSRTVTVCSTDPAPSLDDVFQADVTGKARSVLGDKGLHAMEIDSVGEYRAWSEEMQDKIARALSSDNGGIHVDLSFDRQIFTALLNIVPPGVDEIFAIFKILELIAEKNAKVIIDMAPTGHALELLRMPERMLLWSRLLLKSLAAHRTLPIAQDVAVEIASIGQRVRQLVKILQDAKSSRIMVVMLPEPLPDEETLRLLRSVEELPASVEAIFVNRLLLKEDTSGCARCERARLWQNVTLAKLQKRYASRTIYLIRNFPDEVAGKRGLRDFTGTLWEIA